MQIQIFASDLYFALMVVGGIPAKKDVEVVDLSGQGRNCFKPKDYPFNDGSIGEYINGFAITCGGFPITDKCYKYEGPSRMNRNGLCTAKYDN